MSFVQSISSFIIEGVWYHDAVEIPVNKHLKPNAIPTMFPKPEVVAGNYTFAMISFRKEKTKSSKYLI